MDVQTQRALAHPKRTEILGYLMQKGSKGGADENQLADALGLPRIQLKYHLAILRDADLI